MARLLGLALCLALAAAPSPAEAGQGLLGDLAVGSELSLAAPGAATASGHRALLRLPPAPDAAAKAAKRRARHAAVVQARRERRKQRRAARKAKLAALDPAKKAAAQAVAASGVATAITVESCDKLMDVLQNISDIATSLDKGIVTYEVELSCEGDFEGCDDVLPDLGGARLDLTIRSGAECSSGEDRPVLSFSENSMAEGSRLLSFAADYDGDYNVRPVSSLTVSGLIIDCDGQATGFDLEDLVKATLVDVDFINCEGDGDVDGGAALYLYDTALDITNGLFQSNNATDGGAVYFATYDLGANAVFTKSRFLSNTATENGGAIYVDKESTSTITLTFAGGAFKQNKADGGCGVLYSYRDDAIYPDSGADPKPGGVLTLRILGTTFDDNSTPDDDSIMCGDTDLVTGYFETRNITTKNGKVRSRKVRVPGNFTLSKLPKKSIDGIFKLTLDEAQGQGYEFLFTDQEPAARRHRKP